MGVNNGSLAESRVTDMATRIVASWFQMGQDVGLTHAVFSSKLLNPF